MSIGSASKMEIGILKEASWGVLPSPAVFKTLRVTGESLEIKRENVVSQEVRADRNIPDLIQVGGGAGGGINFELSYASFDDLLEAAMFSSWSGSPANDLVNGVTPQSFHIQKKFVVGTDNHYFLYKGMMIDSLNLNIRSKQIVTGDVTFIGKNGTLSQTITGSTSAANSNPVLNAAAHLALTKVAVSPSPTLLGMTIKINNKLREQPKCEALEAGGVGFGSCEITGNVEIYFSSAAVYDMFLAGTAGGIDFKVGSTAGSKYRFQMPNIKLSNAKVVAGGKDQDLVVAADYQALIDSGIAGSLKISKGVS